MTTTNNDILAARQAELDRQRERILAAAEARGWPACVGAGRVVSNATAWRQEVASALPAVLNELEEQVLRHRELQ